MAEEKLAKDQFIHYETVKLKLTYLVDVDVDVLENLCSDHLREREAGNLYIEDFIDDVKACSDCSYDRGADAFKQADFIEISKYDIPHDVDFV
jgi:hypothetical protein